MNETTQITPVVGYTAKEGLPVEVRPALGPMVIWGARYSGRTLAARSLFEQLAADERTVLAIDGDFAGGGYQRAAHLMGADSLALVDHRAGEPRRWEELRGPAVIRGHCIEAYDGCEGNRRFYEATHSLLESVLSARVMPHLIIDTASELLHSDEEGWKLLHRIAHASRGCGAMVVVVTHDTNPASVCEEDAYFFGPLLGMSRYILMVGDMSASSNHSKYTANPLPQAMVRMCGRKRLQPKEALLAEPTGSFSRIALREDELHLRGLDLPRPWPEEAGPPPPPPRSWQV